jgi:DNA modification methylase
LADLIRELDGEIDLDLTGFDEPSLAELMGESAPDGDEVDAEPQIDKADELQKKWNTALGQVWELGDHRLLCGDSTNKEDVKRLMGGDEADCGFSDPPYGISYKSGTWSDKRKSTLKELKNDNLQSESHHDFLQAFYRRQREVTTGDIYICCEWKSYPVFHKALTELDKLTNVIVWDKRFQTQALNTFAFTHEFVMFFGNNGGPYKDTNVWQCDREFSDFHATPKPVKLVAKALDYSGAKTVTDFFLGSGTTLMACENLGRKCRAIEIDPGYVAVALERWSEATGKTPKLTDGA